MELQCERESYFSIKNVLISKTLLKQCKCVEKKKKVHDLLGSPKEYLDILWLKKKYYGANGKGIKKRYLESFLHEQIRKAKKRKEKYSNF